MRAFRSRGRLRRRLSVWGRCFAPPCPFADRERRVRISIFPSWDGRTMPPLPRRLRAAGRRRRRRFISSVTAHEAPSIHLNHPTIHIFGRISPVQSDIPRIVAGVRRRPLSGICLSVCQSSKCHLTLDPPFLSSPSLPSSISVHWQIGSGIGPAISGSPHSLLSSLATLRHEYKNEAAGASERGRQCGRLLLQKWMIILMQDSNPDSAP